MTEVDPQRQREELKKRNEVVAPIIPPNEEKKKAVDPYGFGFDEDDEDG